MNTKFIVWIWKSVGAMPYSVRARGLVEASKIAHRAVYWDGKAQARAVDLEGRIYFTYTPTVPLADIPPGTTRLGDRNWAAWLNASHNEHWLEEAPAKWLHKTVRRRNGYRPEITGTVIAILPSYGLTVQWSNQTKPKHVFADELILVEPDNA